MYFQSWNALFLKFSVVLRGNFVKTEKISVKLRNCSEIFRETQKFTETERVKTEIATISKIAVNHKRWQKKPDKVILSQCLFMSKKTSELMDAAHGWRLIKISRFWLSFSKYCSVFFKICSVFSKISQFLGKFPNFQMFSSFLH